MEEDVEAVTELTDSGETLVRNGELTAAGQAEHPRSNMEVDAREDTQDLDVVIVATQRQAMKWVVDIQAVSTRPASCKLCAMPFAANELKISMGRTSICQVVLSQLPLWIHSKCDSSKGSPLPHSSCSSIDRRMP